MKIIVRILLFLSIVGIIWHYWKGRQAKRHLLQELIPDVFEALEQYAALTNYQYYFDANKYQKFKDTFKHLYNQIPQRLQFTGFEENEISAMKKFRAIYKELSDKKNSYNKEFIQTESESFSPFFNVLDDHPLSDDQIEAIVSDEVNNLVIAGAGTGKTTTIAGKAAYILKKGLAKPEEILVVSFTNAAVNEMQARISRYCAHLDDYQNIKIKTFSSFGFEVTRTILRNPNLRPAFTTETELSKFFRETFDQLFLSNEDFQKKAINFLAFFSRPPRDEFSFANGNEYYKYEKSYKNRSLDGKTLRSKEEVEIANFLFLQGVNYEYEKLYPIKEEDGDYSYGAYSPDFYLPDYEIWIEHFGIDRHGNVSSRFNGKLGITANERYHSGILWKRKIHEKYNTKLIETYSYENTEGTLISGLKKKLINHQVQFEKLTPEKILEKIKAPEIFDGFIKLLISFMNLLKSNGITPNQVLKKNRSDIRLGVFIDVFSELYKNYEQELRDNEQLDFNDMINRATEGIKGGLFNHRFKYVLVDEFQDMSLGRYNLLKYLRSQNNETKLYCVGDDWQSIYRFAGSDISIITQFEQHFGPTKFSKVLNTYRFNKAILKLTTDFILRNPAQLKKELVSTFEAHESTFELCPISVPKSDLNFRRLALQQAVSSLLRQIDAQSGSRKKIFIIGRYKFNNPEIANKFQNLEIDFYTAHSVKGLTCDISILLEVNNGVYGFPSEVEDDPILNYLLHEGDSFENAEERRLFYVALTRARHKNYILFDLENESKFVTELREELEINKALDSVKICTKCSGRMVQRAGKSSSFWGCSNYPLCN